MRQSRAWADAIPAKLSEAGLGRRKARLERSKIEHFHETSAKLRRTKAWLDYTGVSGSRFLRKMAKGGLDTIKQGLGAANQYIDNGLKNTPKSDGRMCVWTAHA